jgi:hypothetical protein
MDQRVSLALPRLHFKYLPRTAPSLEWKYLITDYGPIDIFFIFNILCIEIRLSDPFRDSWNIPIARGNGTKGG